MYDRYLQPVIEKFTTGEYYREVYNAKQEYFDKAGVIYDDDPEFEQRMCIFMDWYIFDRDLPGVDLAPIKYYLRIQKDELSAEEINVYEDLCNTTHSLFRLKRFTFGSKAMIVMDLFANKKFKVSEVSEKQAFAKGDLFEARVVPFKGEYFFSKGFCFHPKEMEGFILREIKKVRYQEKKKQTKLILQLANMRLKQQRFQHIDLNDIYSFESKL